MRITNEQLAASAMPAEILKRIPEMTTLARSVVAFLVDATGTWNDSEATYMEAKDRFELTNAEYSAFDVETG